MESTRPYESPKGWILKPYNTSGRDAEQYVAWFEGWAKFVRQSHCAWVRLEPALSLGDGKRYLERVLLAPRHEEFPLHVAPPRWPIHVFVAEFAPEYVGAREVPPGGLTVAVWAVLTRYATPIGG